MWRLQAAALNLLFGLILLAVYRSRRSSSDQADLYERIDNRVTGCMIIVCFLAAIVMLIQWLLLPPLPPGS